MKGQTFLRSACLAERQGCINPLTLNLTLLRGYRWNGGPASCSLGGRKGEGNAREGKLRHSQLIFAPGEVSKLSASARGAAADGPVPVPGRSLARPTRPGPSGPPRPGRAATLQEWIRYAASDGRARASSLVLFTRTFPDEYYVWLRRARS